MITRSMFKANDIRGIVAPDPADGVTPTGSPEWDEDGARTIGATYVDIAGLAGKSFILGHDMRVSASRLVKAFAEGAAKRGADVIYVGLVSTDELWYASGAMDLPGVQFTASHNSPDYNGIKFCLPGAQPVTSDFLAQLADDAIARDGKPIDNVTDLGVISKTDVLEDYASYLHSLVPLSAIRPLKVVVDAGNGMAGHTAKAVLDVDNIELIGLYLDLDGTFPHHQPNPLIPENLVDAQRKVVEEKADIGLVFDGDADRCFIIDEQGNVVTPSVVTAVIARAELAREPGAAIVVNSITGHVAHDVVSADGGKLVVSKVGHTYVKALMAEHNAIFGGEHSAHYYFREFWGADTGMLAGLHVLAKLGRDSRPLSEIAAEYHTYVMSGEINHTVTDPSLVMNRIADAFEGKGEITWNDGLQVSSTGASPWWVSVRPSNTEPLLRLNVEAQQATIMEALRDDVSDLIVLYQDEVSGKTAIDAEAGIAQCGETTDRIAP